MFIRQTFRPGAQTIAQRRERVRERTLRIANDSLGVRDLANGLHTRAERVE